MEEVALKLEKDRSTLPRQVDQCLEGQGAGACTVCLGQFCGGR